jgi:hypothetical protein
VSVPTYRLARWQRRSGAPGGAKAPRQGISGNPQRRAEQLAQRRPAHADEPDLSSLRDLAYALAGGSEPSPWWADSHQRILAAARALTWPSRLVDRETQACQIVGDEFHERLNSEPGGMHPSQWLRALAEETGADLRASVADGTGDWPQLWALLSGLALTVPPGGPQSESVKLARETFPDIKDPHATVLAEADQAAKLLADRGLAAGLEPPADGAQPAGDPQVAWDAYGTRFLLVAPFGYDGGAPDHWYAWDVDACWLLTVVAAGVFGSAQDALAEWQHAAGPPATGTVLSPATPELTARLLAPCLESGPMSEILQGYEPRELLREYYRLRRRASALVRPADAQDTDDAEASSDGDDFSPVREAFLDWHETRHGAVPHDAADAVDIILHEWGPSVSPGDRSHDACSPHRIQMAARLIRDLYLADYEALRLLPEWTQWCIEQRDLNADLAARSRAAARTEAAALVDEEKNAPAAQQNEPPFRRQE